MGLFYSISKREEAAIQLILNDFLEAEYKLIANLLINASLGNHSLRYFPCQLYLSNIPTGTF